MNTHSNEKREFSSPFSKKRMFYLFPLAAFPCGFPGCTRSFGVRSNAKRHLRTHGVIPTPATNPNSDAPYIVDFYTPRQSSSSHHQLHSIEGSGGKFFPPPLGGSNNTANAIHHSQDHQGQSDVQQQHETMSSVPTFKLRWMPPSLTTRTNAGSLREVVDEQQMQHWMGDMVEEEENGEDKDGFTAGGNGTNLSHVRCTSRGGYDLDMEQDDMAEDGGDKVEFAENVPRLRRSIPLCPVVIPSSSTSATASSNTGIRLIVSAQGMCRPSSSSSRIIASSISPSSTSSFARSNSSLSPPFTMSGYRQQHEVDHIPNVGGGRGVYTTSISRGYGV